MVASKSSRERHINNITGWAVAILGSLVYLLTIEPSVSFWDSGEFISTSYTLQIGHPPGAPVYQLLAHCFTLLAGDSASVALWSNILSALSGGLTAMFLFWILVRLLKTLVSNNTVVWVASLIGTGCYLFCDTAWFSAVESEVYSLSMLLSSILVWAMLRWKSDATSGDMARVQSSPRWLILVALLASLTTGVHMLGLLTIPTLLLIFWYGKRELRKSSGARLSLRGKVIVGSVCAVIILAGLSVYLIIPIRASANPPINMGDPSTCESFRSYLSRDQYEKAPLIYGRCYNSPLVGYEDGKPLYAPEMDMFFPRMWKQGSHADEYYSNWCARNGKMVTVNGNEYYKPSFGDNLAVFAGYQFGYMYLRYLMWNFSGRFSDQQGFGNLQKGQFITGFPFIDRLYTGSGKPLPSSIANRGNNRYFMLPLILGVIGLIASLRRDKELFWTVMSLFLMGGIVLSIYLNHPVYEPRERDYAYILSFFAFAIWIGIGALAVIDKVSKWSKSAMAPTLTSILLLCIPSLMAFQNWDDHDRSGRYIARDSAANLLRSCEPDAILFTLGDNDTYPLWYIQQVEDYRSDVQIINLSLLGDNSYAEGVLNRFLRTRQDLAESYSDIFDRWRNSGPYGRMYQLLDYNHFDHPVYFSQYANDANADRFNGMLRRNGIAYRLYNPEDESVLNLDSTAIMTSYRLLTDSVRWNPTDNVYIDEVSLGFLRQYWSDVLATAEGLCSMGCNRETLKLIENAEREIPIQRIQSLEHQLKQLTIYRLAGGNADTMERNLKKDLDEQLSYYKSMTPRMQSYIPYTIEPLLILEKELSKE